MKENILQTLNNLNVIKDNLQNISLIEKDILLQEIRNLYVTVLKIEPVEEEEEAKDIHTAPINLSEKTQPEINEKEIQEIEETPTIPTEETQPAELTETLSSDLLDLFEEEAEDAPMLIMPEINEHHVEANVADTPEVKPNSEPVLENTEIAEEPTKEQPAEEQVDNESELFTDNTADEIVLDAEENGVEKDSQTETVSLSDDLLQFLPQENDTAETQPIVETTQEPKITKQTETPVVEEVHAKTETSEPVYQERRSLNDLLQAQHEEKSLSDKMQQSKIDDLLKAISLNDKFLFIRELFDGKGEDFSNCIQKLNHCANIDEAFESLEIMKKHYFWESTSAAYLSLCDLIRRRYI